MTRVTRVAKVTRATRTMWVTRKTRMARGGFLKYRTLLVFQLFSWRLSLCHSLCNRLRLCISVPFSFLNSYHHKLSENIWVWGSRGSRSGDLVGCYHSGTDDDDKKER